MVRKPRADQPHVPKGIVRAFINVGQARGKLGAAELISLLVRSKVDRLLTLR
jgi:hypothetical protein